MTNGDAQTPDSRSSEQSERAVLSADIKELTRWRGQVEASITFIKWMAALVVAAGLTVGYFIESLSAKISELRKGTAEVEDERDKAIERVREAGKEKERELAFLAYPVGSIIGYGGPLRSEEANASVSSDVVRETLDSLNIAGWMLCDGRELNKADYNDLYRVIGEQYGSAGPGKFRIPDYNNLGAFLRPASSGQPVGHVREAKALVSHRHQIGEFVGVSEQKEYEGTLNLYGSNGTLGPWIVHGKDNPSGLKAGTERTDDYKQFARNGAIYSDSAEPLAGGAVVVEPKSIAVHYLIKVMP